MKNRYQIPILAFSFLFATSPLLAQGDISNIFKAGLADVNTLADGYMKPAGLGFASGLGANWYNTAATHKVLGFDLTFGVSASMTPTSDQTFSLTGLTNLKPTIAGTTEAPTFGGSGKGVGLYMPNSTFPNDPSKALVSFDTPDGITKIIPTPNLQLTVGLPKGADISIRYTPDVKAKGMSVGLWGIGLKHDVKQWIPGVKLLPFDASVMVGYSTFNLDYEFDKNLQPEDLGLTTGTYVSPAGAAYANQGFNIKASALMANLIISKKLAFFTPYLGLGLTTTNFDMNFGGTYPIADQLITTGPNAGKMQLNAITDPIKLSYSEVMPGATVGFRLKMLFALALHAQYTIQKYPTASVGFGINIR